MQRRGITDSTYDPETLNTYMTSKADAISGEVVQEEVVESDKTESWYYNQIKSILKIIF